MLTPQEAESHVFPKASFGGYNMLQVDAFLDKLIGDYRTLFQENAALKSKLKVLVDKVEEYRATEDAMRRALHSAQKMAEELIREGETRKRAAIEQAVSEVKQHSDAARAVLMKEEEAVRANLENTQAQLADEQLRLETARSATAAFVDKLKDLYAQELTFIGSLSELSAPPAAPPPPAPASGEQEAAQAAHEIEASMAKILDEPAPAGAEAADDTKVFDQIEFGKDYDIG